MRKTARLPPIWTALTVALIGIGCSSGDERLVELSRQSTERQAEQNRLVETNSRQVLETTNKLVEADAKSRTENIELHRQIETERSGINQQRDVLEQERRQIAVERNRDPIVSVSRKAPPPRPGGNHDGFLRLREADHWALEIWNLFAA